MFGIQEVLQHRRVCALGYGGSTSVLQAGGTGEAKTASVLIRLIF